MTNSPTASPTLDTPAAQGLTIGIVIIFYTILIFAVLQCCSCASKVKNNQRLYNLLDENLRVNYEDVKAMPEATEKDKAAKDTAMKDLYERAKVLRKNKGVYADLVDAVYVPATENKLAHTIDEFMWHSATGRAIDINIKEMGDNVQMTFNFFAAGQLTAYGAYWVSTSGVDSQSREIVLLVALVLMLGFSVVRGQTNQFMTSKMGGDTGVIESVTDEQLIERYKRDHPEMFAAMKT